MCSISDLQQIKLMTDIGVDDATRGNFVSAFGVCMVAGGKLSGTSINKLGGRGHTTLMNILTIVSVSSDRRVGHNAAHCMPPTPRILLSWHHSSDEQP